MISERPSWDEYFMKVAHVVSERSNCRRHHIGAVVVKNKRILTTGYNGAAAGIKDCLERGCKKDELNIETARGHEICRAVHAEMNAIIQGALHGINVEGSTIYCTHSPCNHCAKAIVNSRIKRYVTSGEYADQSFLELFQEAGIEYVKLNKPKLHIKELP